MASIPVASDAVRFARGNRVPAIILLLGLAIAIAYARRGQLPDRRQTAGLIGAAIFVVLVASYVPDVVAAFLGALIVVMAIESADTVAAVFDKILGLIGSSARPVTGSLATQQREG